MNKANDFMRAAAQLSALEAEVKPKPGAADPYKDLRSLICYHLHTAAKNARVVGEALAAFDVAEEAEPKGQGVSG